MLTQQEIEVVREALRMWRNDLEFDEERVHIDKVLAKLEAAPPVEAIQKLIDYGMPLGATNDDWSKWRDEVSLWLQSRKEEK